MIGLVVGLHLLCLFFIIYVSWVTSLIADYVSIDFAFVLKDSVHGVFPCDAQNAKKPKRGCII